MVKGISRQVIVVHSPDPKLFEQAIFILKDGAVGDGVSDDLLIREAERVIRSGDRPARKGSRILFRSLWACFGALATGAVWFLSTLF